MTFLVSALSLLSVSVADIDSSDIVQKGFKDASFDLKVVQANFSELKKIDNDFDKQYRFKSVKLSVKEPLMLRMEARVEDTTVLYIVNGFKRLSRVPRINVNVKEDLKDAPGKIQTPMDFGIISAAALSTLFEAKYVRTDRATGDYVFDLTYKRPRFTDTTRHRIWVDPEKRFTAKREVYNQHGRHLSTFFYERPENEGGVWMPTRVTVRNVEGKVAAVSEVVSLKLNSGLSESIFVIK
jgi:outer membrane lipoprotein-sorting protein